MKGDERRYVYGPEARRLSEWGYLVGPVLDESPVGDGYDYSEGEEGPGND